MNSDRLRRIEDLYHGVLALPGSGREAFLFEACGDDAELKAEVESLIAHADADADSDRLFLPIAEAVVSTFAARLAAGDRVGPYTVVDFLGAGGMGEVYCARDPRLQRDVAIKVLPAAEVDPDRQRRLLAEARAAGALNHPNILTVYDVGVHAESPFIVSELLRGETLRQAINRGPLAIPLALDLAIEIARGCAAAHEHGIVHRDLKPENLFVTRDGRVKILDFGLARQTSSVPITSSAETATQVAGQIPAFESPASAQFGTAGYMSPEQVRGERIDHRADIFALGAIVYEMATGHRAFARPSNADAMRAVLSDEPPAMTTSRPIPAGLESIVRRCLAKDPADRFQSAREMLRELEQLRRASDGSAIAPTPIHKRRRMTALAVVAALLIVTTLALRPWRFVTSETPSIKAIAVLPLTVQGTAGEYLADGMTEALISDLSRLSNVRVISRSSSMSYKATQKSLAQIATELTVDALVDGSVTESDGRIRVAVRVLDAGGSHLLWNQTFERDAKEVLTLGNDVARALADQIHATLSAEQRARLTSARAIEPRAYEAYLRGRYFLAKGAEHDLQRAIADFTMASTLDPFYAAPYAGLADAYTAQRSVFLPPHEVMPKAREAAATALRLDPNLAEAHVSMGGVLMFYDFDWIGAEREFLQAIDLSPNLAAAHDYYGMYFAALGRTAEARREARKARDLDPLSLPIMVDSGWVHYLAREYDDTVRENTKAIDLDPAFWPALRDLGLGYEKVGRFPESIDALKRARQLDANSTILEMLGGSYAAFGHAGEARRVLGELSAQAATHYVCPYEIATVHMALFDKESALRSLEDGVKQRADCMPWAAADPKLDALHSDPRFHKVLEDIGLRPRSK